MTKRKNNHRHSRRGAVVVLVATMMVVLVAIVAFAVDIGAVLKVKTDMQRSADAAVLAAVQALAPDPDGSQDQDEAKAVLRDYVELNLDDVGSAFFSVDDADIEIGRYDPSSVYQNVSLLNDGTMDAVRVTLRRDGTVNPRAPLFFGRALGINDASLQVTSTAVLQKPNMMRPGADILPFAIHVDVWDATDYGESLTAYGDGKVEDDNGNEVPGNWGTCDVGNTNNSTADLRDQILNGLKQSDLNALHADGRISQSTHIDGSVPLWVQADTGLSSGLKHAVEAVEGLERLIPIYDTLGGGNGNGNGASGNGNGNGNGGGGGGNGGGTGNGNNLEYHIIGWGVVTVGESNWNGANNTWVQVTRAHMYSGDLAAKPNSLSQPAAIEGAYGAAVLVE